MCINADSATNRQNLATNQTRQFADTHHARISMHTNFSLYKALDHSVVLSVKKNSNKCFFRTVTGSILYILSNLQYHSMEEGCQPLCLSLCVTGLANYVNLPLTKTFPIFSGVYWVPRGFRRASRKTPEEFELEKPIQVTIPNKCNINVLVYCSNDVLHALPFQNQEEITGLDVTPPQEKASACVRGNQSTNNFHDIWT